MSSLILLTSVMEQCIQIPGIQIFSNVLVNEALPGVLGNRGIYNLFQGNTGIKMMGTREQR